MGYEMNPCFWDEFGNEIVSREDGTEPCRTVCGNGNLDIGEDCEPVSYFDYANPTINVGCHADIEDEVNLNVYPFCS